MSETSQFWTDKNKSEEQKRLKKIATKLGMTVYGLAHALNMAKPKDLHLSAEKVEAFFAPIGELFAEAMALQKAYAERRKLIDPDFGR